MFARQQTGMAQEVLDEWLPDLPPPVLDEAMPQPVLNLGGPFLGLAEKKCLTQAGDLFLEEELRAGIFPAEGRDVRLAAVAVQVLSPEHRGEHVITYAGDDVKAPAEVLVSEEAHGSEEEPLLALQPVNRGAGILFVDGVDEEINRRH